MNNIKFKTYSWCYGTTSFRVSELKYKIEKQLILLKELKDKYKDEMKDEEKREELNKLENLNFEKENLIKKIIRKIQQ